MPSEHDKIDTERVVADLNTILELELAGVVRYVHYSLMIFGHARIPIIGWMRNQEHIVEVEKVMRKPGELTPAG